MSKYPLIISDCWDQQIINTTLEIEGRPPLQPFPTSFVASQPSLKGLLTSSASNVTRSLGFSGAYPTRTANTTMSSMLQRSRSHDDLQRTAATDCFQPVATGPVPSSIRSRGDHPVPRLGIVRKASPVADFNVTDHMAARLRKVIQYPPISSMLTFSSVPKVREYGLIHTP